MGPRLKVSSDRLVKPGIEPATPGLQGKRFIHYTTAPPAESGLGLLHVTVWKWTRFLFSLFSYVKNILLPPKVNINSWAVMLNTKARIFLLVDLRTLLL